MGNVYGKYLLIKTGPGAGTVAITQVEHATISASATSGNEGDKVTISIAIDTGYKLSNFVINGVNTQSTTFNLKEGENTVTAVIYKAEQLTAPLLSKSTNTYDAYSFYISNQNTATVYYYIDNSKVGSLKSGESKYCKYTWGTSETYISFVVKFSDPNETYSDSGSSTVEFTRPEKEITYYTLTVVYSGCDKNSDTYQIEEGVTVNPNNYGTAPSGYTIKSRSPSSNFTMSSDKTITITCEEEKVYYTLTIIYSGCSKASEDYTIESGTTITPSNYGTAPSGYVVKSRNPSSNFTMSSDKTITITCEEEITYYTLTILYSGCSKDSETYQIKSGTTVYPSNYGTAPTGYKVSSRSPSSSFTMNSDTTITITCEEEETPITCYTLTITYSGCDKDDETHQIESGTTVYPSDYGTAPSGYTVISRSPSSSFVMTGDKTITITCELETTILEPYIYSPSSDSISYSAYIKNNNSTSANLYVDGSLVKSNLGSGESYFYEKEWGSSETTQDIECFFEIDGETSGIATEDFVKPAKVVCTITVEYYKDDVLCDSITNTDYYVGQTFQRKTFIKDYSGYEFSKSSPDSSSITLTSSTYTFKIYYISSYKTLTINHYKIKDSNILAKTTKEQIYRNTTVSSSNYAISMDYCTYDHADQTSVQMTEDKTINLYYSVKTFVLQIDYSGYSSSLVDYKNVYGGDTVVPSNQATKIPDGYRAVLFQPSSSFTMTGDTSMTIYLEKYCYTLTVYVLNGTTSVATKTYQVEFGNTVRVSDYTGVIPSGYVEGAYTTSQGAVSSFTMGSDNTITFYVSESKATETATFTVYVSDICLDKKCTSLVTGSGKNYCDTSATGSGSNTCCSGTTDLCMTTTGCPYVFSSVSWDSTFTTGGYKYTYISDTGTGKTYCTATYEKEAV